MAFIECISLFDPGSGTFFRRDLVMKLFSTAILSLPLIQVGQLSVAGEIECALNTG